MTKDSLIAWQQANQQQLLVELEFVRQSLLKVLNNEQRLSHVINLDHKNNKFVTLFDQLCIQCELTEFERFLLLLCLGYELDASFAHLCAELHGDAHYAFPTLSLIYKVFPEIHLDALAINSSLIYWQLIEVERSAPLALSRLRISERILHFLLGSNRVDRNLLPYIKPVSETAVSIASQQAIAEQLVLMLKSQQFNSSMIIQLVGEESSSHEFIVKTVCQLLEWRLITIDLLALPTDIRELEPIIRLFEREALLNWGAYLLIAGENSVEHVQQQFAINYFCERLIGVCFISGFVPKVTRAITKINVPRPSLEEQKLLWKHIINNIDESALEKIVMQFNLSVSQFQAINFEYSQQLKTKQQEQPNKILWDICRQQLALPLQGLADIIQPRANWQQLVLPEAQLMYLHELVIQLKQRHRVYQEWGFADKYTTGLGIGALFAGPSGTGKTFAAEIIAHELGLDLYRIDLSTLVSKYIGETEKNLKKIFTIAENSGAILLFDEADAIFGKRSEVKDSHDRYANLEVSYLLQKMEAYRGLVILTTNLKSAIDSAFLRRLRFIIQFPFPNLQQRAEIWRKIFPQKVPQANLDVQKLARLNLSGGNIRNIAMNAAFLAANDHKPVQMRHLLRAAHIEHAKLEVPLTELEVGDWV